MFTPSGGCASRARAEPRARPRRRAEGIGEADGALSGRRTMPIWCRAGWRTPDRPARRAPGRCGSPHHQRNHHKADRGVRKGVLRLRFVAGPDRLAPKDPGSAPARRRTRDGRSLSGATQASFPRCVAWQTFGAPEPSAGRAAKACPLEQRHPRCRRSTRPAGPGPGSTALRGVRRKRLPRPCLERRTARRLLARGAV